MADGEDLQVKRPVGEAPGSPVLGPEERPGVAPGGPADRRGHLLEEAPVLTAVAPRKSE